MELVNSSVYLGKNNQSGILTTLKEFCKMLIEDFLKFLNDFDDNEKLVCGLNSTFIALIKKKIPIFIKF
jgi:hypothetical protein